MYERSQGAVLNRRLTEAQRTMQVVVGPRHVGKTTLVRQVTDRLDVPVHFASADMPTRRREEWILRHWDAARLAAGRGEGILVLDEVQQALDWAASIQRLWVEDGRARRRLHVVLVGPPSIQQALTASLAGRFELLRLMHWTASEMRDAFGWGTDQFIFYGGYPGAAPLIADHEHWARYVQDVLIESTLARDVLLVRRVHKPSLLLRLFELSCGASGHVLPYSEMLRQLRDAGNTTTLARYLELLSAASTVSGLSKFTGKATRKRASSPKLQVFNTALMSLQSGYTLEEARADRSYWGRLVISAVGAHLANAMTSVDGELFYWRDRGRDVDFVVQARGVVLPIEVARSAAARRMRGIFAFGEAFNERRRLRIGRGGVSVASFLLEPVERWLNA